MLQPFPEYKKIAFVVRPENKVQLWTPTPKEYNKKMNGQKWEHLAEGSFVRFGKDLTQVIAIDLVSNQNFYIVFIEEVFNDEHNLN